MARRLLPRLLALESLCFIFFFFPLGVGHIELVIPLENVILLLQLNQYFIHTTATVTLLSDRISCLKMYYLGTVINYIYIYMMG